MADPARKWGKDEVPGNVDSSPPGRHLRDLGGGGEDSSGPWARGKLRVAPSPDDLQEQEENPQGQRHLQAVPDAPENQPSHTYTKGGKNQGFLRGRLFKTKRRTAAVVAGTMVAIAAVSIMLFLMLLPLQPAGRPRSVQLPNWATSLAA